MFGQKDQKAVYDKGFVLVQSHKILDSFDEIEEVEKSLNEALQMYLSKGAYKKHFKDSSDKYKIELRAEIKVIEK